MAPTATHRKVWSWPLLIGLGRPMLTRLSSANTRSCPAAVLLFLTNHINISTYLPLIIEFTHVRKNLALSLYHLVGGNTFFHFVGDSPQFYQDARCLVLRLRQGAWLPQVPVKNMLYKMDYFGTINQHIWFNTATTIPHYPFLVPPKYAKKNHMGKPWSNLVTAFSRVVTLL